MTTHDRIIRITALLSGLISAAFFAFDAFVFARLYPPMIRFESVPAADEGLVNWVGVGWLVFLFFLLVSLYRIARHVKQASHVRPAAVILIAAGILALLFVFSNVALLGDIGKQYKAGLSQPEWSILFGLSGFQFLVTLILSGYHVLGEPFGSETSRAARDQNIFTVVQFVGIICGLMGLGFSSLGFLFPRAWSPVVHTTATLIILLIPYGMALGYWFVTKLQETPRQWYDEKQLQDTGKSAYLTLILSVLFMTGLFAACFNDLGGVVRMLWFPLYIFFVLLVFSAGNLFFSGKA